LNFPATAAADGYVLDRGPSAASANGIAPANGEPFLPPRSARMDSDATKPPRDRGAPPRFTYARRRQQQRQLFRRVIYIYVYYNKSPPARRAMAFDFCTPITANYLSTARVRTVGPSRSIRSDFGRLTDDRVPSRIRAPTSFDGPVRRFRCRFIQVNPPRNGSTNEICTKFSRRKSVAYAYKQ
jgi:hypothetical protein